jgi:hypothetical protein
VTQILVDEERLVSGSRRDETGDAFYQPPGRRPYIDVGTELLQFSPTAQLAETERLRGVDE